MSKLAVVVGVSTYSDNSIKSLPAARADAEAMAERLKGPHFGFDVEVLLDDDATRSNVLRTLFLQRQRKPTDFVFFFAGHGAKSENGTAIVLHDATEYDLGISLEELVSQRLRFEGGNVTIVLDCCHSGSVRVRGSAFPRATTEDLRRGLVNADGSLSAIAACLPEEVAFEFDELGHGLLTYNMLEGMRGLAADDAGRITPTSLYTFVAALMNEAASQTPCFRGSVDSTCVLGSDFPSRQSLASRPGEMDEMTREAEVHYDHYMANRARVSGIQDRREFGFLNDCRLLEEKMRWLEKAIRSAPSLNNSPQFLEIAQAMRAEQAYLCNLTVGTVIPGAQVTELLGSGGFGSVWLVETSDGARQAFKVYHSNELWDVDKVGRFQTGYRANRQLTHPNIVEVYEERLVPLGFFMQAIDGPNLRDAGAASWDVDSQLQFLVDAAETLQYAHDKGVIHRDIKPENILVRWDHVRQDFEPVISDFDLAWFSTATQRTQGAMGMALYAPPEQRDFINQDAVRQPMVDVFSFAQVLYFLVTGRDPLVNQTERNLSTLRSALEDNLPATAMARLLTLYETCSSFDPAQRYADFEGIVSALREARSDYERAQRDDPLPLTDFLAELARQVNGSIGGVKSNFRDFSLTSRTGRTELLLLKVHDRGDECGFELRFRPTQEFGVIGSKNADLRRIVNQQLDRSLARSLVSAKRRSGHEGVYEVFVEVDPVPLRSNEVTRVADACLRTIRVMEGLAS